MALLMQSASYGVAALGLLYSLVASALSDPPVVVDVAPTPVVVATAAPITPTTHTTAPRAASTPRTAPTPWNPPLVVCPRPIDGKNGEWINLTSPPVCEPDHVYGFVAPPGWRIGDPVPPFRKAP